MSLRNFCDHCDKDVEDGVWYEICITVHSENEKEILIDVCEKCFAVMKMAK